MDLIGGIPSEVCRRLLHYTSILINCCSTINVELLLSVKLHMIKLVLTLSNNKY